MTFLDPKTGQPVSIDPAGKLITWRLTQPHLPNTELRPDFTAVRGEQPIGWVRQVEDGPDRGLWLWTLTAVRSGAEFDFPTSGRCTERAQAGRLLLQAYYHALIADPAPAAQAKRRLAALMQSQSRTDQDCERRLGGCIGRDCLRHQPV